MRPSENIIEILDLPRQTAKQIEEAIRKERRTPAQLMREALRTYLWLRDIPEETRGDQAREFRNPGRTLQ
jgi:hypothetical protein